MVELVPGGGGLLAPILAAIQSVGGGATAGTSGGFDADTIESIDAQIADLEGQITQAQEGGGGAGPDYSAFFKSPGYEFRLDEGVRAIDRSASARGQLMGGGILRELQRYGQGLAASEFGNYANRLSALAGIGQTANQQGIYAGAAAGGQVGRSVANIGQSIMAGGTAAASGIVGGQNALSQGITGAFNNFGTALQQFSGGPNWGAINQQAFNTVNNPAYAGIF